MGHRDLLAHYRFTEPYHLVPAARMGPAYRNVNVPGGRISHRCRDERSHIMDRYETVIPVPFPDHGQRAIDIDGREHRRAEPGLDQRLRCYYGVVHAALDQVVLCLLLCLKIG